MGIIQRQTIKQSLVSYAGLLLGVVNTIWITPLAFGVDGLAQFIISQAGLLMPFATLGVTGLTVKFFKQFEDDKQQHHGYLGILFCLLLIAFSFFLLAGWLLYQPAIQLLGFWGFNAAKFADNAPFVVTLTFLMATNTLLTYYASNFHRIAIPQIFNVMFLKLGLPLLVLGYYFSWLEIVSYKTGILVVYLCITVGLVWYIWSLGQFHVRPNFRIINKTLARDMWSFAWFAAFASLGSMLAFRLDGIMIPGLIKENGEALNSVYSKLFFLVSVLEYPYLSVCAIAAPVLTAAWKRKDLQEIRTVYQKSSINLLIAGLFIFLCIWTCHTDIFSLSPKGKEAYMAGKYVLLFLGLGKLIDVSFGVNNQIIIYSDYYRFHLYATLLLGILNALANYYLIPKWGITGAAVATLGSLTLYNLIKLVYIWWKLGMQPFSMATVKALLLACLAFAVAGIIPDTGMALVNMALRGLVILLIFGGGVWWARLSEEINGLVEGVWRKTMGGRRNP